jgi:cell wall-associated NlpC family hydrolase
MSLTHSRFRMPALALATAALSSSAVLMSPMTASAAPVTAGAVSAGAVATTTAPSTTVSSARLRAQAAALARATAVLSTAASLKGRPYRYGATGPKAFDCSGYVKYVYARNGIKLPRTAQQQYRASRKISKSQIRKGDLVFFGGAHKYHVAVYAGDGMIWHAPSSGKTVRKVKIWTTRWSAGRVI